MPLARFASSSRNVRAKVLLRTWYVPHTPSIPILEDIALANKIYSILVFSRASNMKMFPIIERQIDNEFHRKNVFLGQVLSRAYKLVPVRCLGHTYKPKSVSCGESQ